MSTNQIDSNQAFSGVAQTAAIGSSTSVSSGAAKIFREFKWGLLTLFILMTVVVCLVYDGGRGKKKNDVAQSKAGAGIEAASDLADPTASKVADNSNGTGSTSALTSAPEHPAIRTEDQPSVWDVVPNPGTPLRRLNSAEANGAPNESGTAHASGNSGANSHTRSNNRIPDIGNSDGVGAQMPSGNGQQHPSRAQAQGDMHENSSHDGAFKYYTVKAGDNLSKIASANLPGKGGIKAIQDANKDVLPDANRLREGMKLKIPNTNSSASVAETSEHNGASTAAGNRPTNTRPNDSSDHHSGPTLITKDDYVVQAGDTLERIARRVLNDSRKWKELQEWNKDRIADSSKLKVGMVLHTHPPGSSQMASPTSTEAQRFRRNTVRAEAEPQGQAPNDLENLPNAEEVPIPIHPVAANVTAASGRTSDKTDAPKNSKSNKNDARPKKAEQEDDAIIRGIILP